MYYTLGVEENLNKIINYDNIVPENYISRDGFYLSTAMMGAICAVL